MSVEARLEELKVHMREEEEESIMAEEETRANKALIVRMKRDGAFVKGKMTESTFDAHVKILEMVKVNKNTERKKSNKRRQESMLKEKKELEASLAEDSACKKQRSE